MAKFEEKEESKMKLFRMLLACSLMLGCGNAAEDICNKIYECGTSKQKNHYANQEACIKSWESRIEFAESQSVQDCIDENCADFARKCGGLD